MIERAASTLPRRAIAALVVATFALCTAGAGLWDALRPARPPQLTGDEGVQREHERARARWHDGSLTALWGQDANERSNLRRVALPWYAATMLRFFRETTSGAVVGRDGWLFCSRNALGAGIRETLAENARGAHEH